MAEAGSSPLGLGIDVGGGGSRWALARASGEVLARGTAAPFVGAMVASDGGLAQVRATLEEIATAAGSAARAGAGVEAFGAVVAGVTGHDADSGPVLHTLLAETLALSAAAVHLFNDVELACRLAFEPGTGCLVYAGTGSIGVFVDAAGRFHRVGGRGGLIGDEGSGYWIAREALARLWRAEDESPGSVTAGALGRHLAAALGGPSWDHTRHALVHRSRGEFGHLALAVAAAAAEDAMAAQVLCEAGAALARLARVLLQRHGTALPAAVAGRVFDLDPLVLKAMQADLPVGTVLRRVAGNTEAGAAVRAARAAVAA